MKNSTQSFLKSVIFLFATVVAVLLLHSCKKCELIEHIVTPAPTTCEGTFYLLKAAPGIDLAFDLHEFPKPVPIPFSSLVKAGPFNVPVLSFFDIRSNFSAFDNIGGQYVFQHFYTTDAQFFNYNLSTGLPTLTPGGPVIDVCPVFNKGRVFTIYVEQFSSNDWLYSISEVNPLTGQDGVGLTGNTITTNSSLFAEAMSSVSTGGDLIYFLSGTNLIEYKLSDNSTRHIDIDPTYHQIDNIVTYFGLEYKPDDDLLIAMRNRNNSMGVTVTELVSINISNSTPVVTSIFDISAKLPTEHDRMINPEYYSTTFDPCDNTYYVTSLESGMTLDTYFTEINLPRNDMKLQTLNGYWYGIHFAEK